MASPWVRFACVIVAGLFVCNAGPGTAFGQAETPATDSETDSEVKSSIAKGIEQLLELQTEEGLWPYEGVYRVNRQIPVGYRIGGTAICCQAILYSTPDDDEKANRAIEKAVEQLLKELQSPRMKPSRVDRYDVRIWGHIYALDLFCRLVQSKRFESLHEQLEPQLKELTDAVLFQELKSGGWNYANRRAHAAFVTSPAIQSLLWAKQCGQEVPNEVLARAAKALHKSRSDNGAFAYSGNARANRPTALPGSIARSATVEYSLHLLGEDRVDAIQDSVDAFYTHWDELEKRRKKTGTHKPPYGVAPYYFYFGHRGVAQAITLLPKEKQKKEFKRHVRQLMKTRDDDGTWNDRVFARSKCYGTAMALLALNHGNVPNPKPVKID